MRFLRQWLALCCAAAIALPAMAEPADALMIEGELALRAHDAHRAEHAFEQAGALRHEATSEWGLVRSWMQLGEYPRALAYAAHAAEGHGDLPEGTSLYAWLLHIGGQVDMAQRVMQAALKRHPGHPFLLATARRLVADTSAPEPLLLQGVTRQGPELDAALPVGAQAVASGLLLSANRRVLVPASAVQGNATVWLRDASGRTARATVQGVSAVTGLAELSLPGPWAATTQKIPLVARDANAGSPCMAVEFAMPARGEVAPSWPVLRTGFVGRWVSEQRYALGMPLGGAGAHGGPVYDTAGRLIGVAMRGADGRAQLVPASVLLAAWPQAFDSTGDAAGALTPDAVYERAMGVVVEVIAIVGTP